MVDLFEEVEEQLRSDRYVSLARKAAPWVTGILLAVLLGYAGYWGFKAYQDRNAATASAAYQKGVDALSQNDQTGAFSDFETAAKAGVPAYKSLSLMQEGGLRQLAGKDDEAAALYDQAAAAAPNPIFHDLAALRAAMALLEKAPYAQEVTRLQPLIDSKRPFSAEAREALAMAKLFAGKTSEARADFSAISINLDTTEEMRRRAQLAVAVIDSGETPTAIAAAKLAATLPPPAQPSVPPPQAPDAGGGAPQQAEPGAAQ